MCIIVLFLGKQHYDSLWLFQTSLSLYYSSPPSSAFTFLTTPKCSPPPIFWSGHLYLLVPSLLLPNPPILAMVLFYFTGFCSYYRLCILNWRFGVTALFFETLVWNSSTNLGWLVCLHFQALVLQAVKLLFLKWFLEIELEIFCQNPFHRNVRL